MLSNYKKKLDKKSKNQSNYKNVNYRYRFDFENKIYLTNRKKNHVFCALRDNL